MIKRILLLGFISLISITPSCKRDKLDGDKKILSGTWNWKRSLLYKKDPNGNDYLYDIDSAGGSFGTSSVITFQNFGKVSITGTRQHTKSSKRITFNSFNFSSTDNSYAFDLKIYNCAEIKGLTGKVLDRSVDTLIVNEIPWPSSSGDFSKTTNIYVKQ